MKKILILYPYPFIKRDYERFGIEILKKSFDVKVLNLAPWLRPDIWKKYSDTIFDFNEYFTITCKKDFINFIKKSNFDIIFDFMYTDAKTNWIRKKLKNKKNFFVKIEVNAIPEPEIQIIGNIKKGIYLTELMGSSVNLINGDYSRGGSGFWIDKGEITYPINEITIAGNLTEMFKKMSLANDLEFKQGLNSPTMLIEDMTVAG